MAASCYSICAFCEANNLWCDASFGGFPCTRCRSMRTSCCARGKVPISPNSPSGSTYAVGIQPETESEYLRGMAEDSQVHLTKPLDNLVTELHDFLGLGHSYLAFVPVLPQFIQRLPENVPEEDMEYLEIKGAFRVPDTIFRHELLKAFVENVYPFLPVLDLESFLLPIVSNDGAQPVSLLLFHAVMFSATAFVELKYIHNAGYETRKELREAYYRRVRAFYDFDIERDRVVLIQALLLMTYWHETPDIPKDSQHWLNVCWSLGVSIGLDCDPSTSAMAPQLQKIWKRLWWCLYTRDMLLALNLRRPLCYVKDNHEQLPLVCVEDFSIGYHSTKIIMALGGCNLLQNVQLQLQLAVGFIEKAKLSMLINRVLLLRDHQEKNWCQESCTDRGWEAVQSLQAWCDELPVELQYASLQSDSNNLDHATKLLHIQRAWIRVIFLAAIGTLHRESRRPPRVQYENIIRETSSILEDLNQLGLVQYLPTTTVALLVPVLARQVLKFRDSKGCVVGIEDFERFYQSMQVLGTFGQVYPSAVTVKSFFEEALRSAKQGPSYTSMPSAIRSLLTEEEQNEFVSSGLCGVRGNI